MAGHSHWAGIKHKKAVVDAKRGKIFSRLAKLISVAARSGGGDPDMNLTLKYAIERAKAANMPKENIERAIKKGTGELAGVEFEEIVYEGYGPGGVAVMLKVLTDNRNRTAGELRRLFERHGGSIGRNGCVAWQFEMKSFFIVSGARGEEKVLEAALEGGAEDVRKAEDEFEIIGPPEACEAIREALDKAGIEVSSGEVTNLPGSTVALDEETGRRALRLLQALEEHDDVESTDTNLFITVELLAAVEGEE